MPGIYGRGWEKANQCLSDSRPQRTFSACVYAWTVSRATENDATLNLEFGVASKNQLRPWMMINTEDEDAALFIIATLMLVVLTYAPWLLRLAVAMNDRFRSGGTKKG